MPILSTIHMPPVFTLRHRHVVPGGAGVAMAPPDFGRSVNPISTKGGRLCTPNDTDTPGFSDLATAVHKYLFVLTLRVRL